MSFIGISGVDNLESALVRAKKDGAGAIIAPLNAFTYRYREKLVQLALKHQLPRSPWRPARTS